MSAFMHTFVSPCAGARKLPLHFSCRDFRDYRNNIIQLYRDGVSTGSFPASGEAPGCDTWTIELAYAECNIEDTYPPFAGSCSGDFWLEGLARVGKEFVAVLIFIAFVSFGIEKAVFKFRSLGSPGERVFFLRTSKWFSVFSWSSFIFNLCDAGSSVTIARFISRVFRGQGFISIRIITL